MSGTISFNEMIFSSTISSIEQDADFTIESGQVEMTGKAESLEEFIANLEQIKELLTEYQSFLSTETIRIRSASTAIVEAEAALMR